jgi:trimethylamine--corrinoid protein Co-methyltransferase
MKLQVLSENEIIRVHESTLKILAETGVRVETALGRKYLADAGAEVDENTKIVKFPRDLVEKSLELTPKDFTLGARRPGWDLKMNAGESTLCADGSGTTVYDWQTEEFRPSTYQDWLNMTRILDVVDEIGVYWTMVDWGRGDDSNYNRSKLWSNLFGNFSKHVQDGISHKDQARC